VPTADMHSMHAEHVSCMARQQCTEKLSQGYT